MMPPDSHSQLSRRERQIMDVIYQCGRASAAEVMAVLPHPPGYSAVRALLRILEAKGHLRHKEDGARYIYTPTHPRANAGRQALERVVRTFYHGSLEKAVAALLDVSERRLSPTEVERLQALIRQTRSEGR